VTGIFDLLHVEHVRFLAAAKAVDFDDDPRQHFFDTLGSESSLTSSSPPGKNKSKVLFGSSSMISKMPPSDHPGLRKAPSSPVKLIVGIEADVRVRKLKGAGRPVMGQADRKEILQGLKMVDEVFNLPEDFDNDKAYEKVLKDTGADIYAVSENSPFMENKRRICRKAGVTLKVVCRYNPEYSTSRIVNRIKGL